MNRPVCPKDLDLLSIDDPVKVRNSENVIEFWNKNLNRGLLAFSVDVKYLQYCIPHNKLRRNVNDCIKKRGTVAFPNKSENPRTGC